MIKKMIRRKIHGLQVVLIVMRISKKKKANTHPLHGLMKKIQSKKQTKRGTNNNKEMKLS